ncbi:MULTISPECIES: hypothetical protein [unclassified Nocardioides]|uniref:hypothetical protein n=1 Tax=unclassified Nocardioides TaxID=2615069 RepID=UPI0006F582D1|nr:MULTISPECIES: hypothetical protein [unclassified Nocardioides]KRA32380.1 hypothetical protein ASD81_12435 [Nocardioides sp. Root614]KRA89032.1 hypothetical protein ASD84_12700 [Nocardioides sp. Root682]
MSMLRAIAATAAALLCGLISLTACGGNDDDPSATAPGECQTSELELPGVQPASSPQQAVRDLLVLKVPGGESDDSLMEITDVVDLTVDRARVDVTIGSWDGGYEVEHEDDGWVVVAGISCGEPLACSDFVDPDTGDAYSAALCAESSN